MTKKDERSSATLSREQLLELQLMNQKGHRILAQLEALTQRKNSISMEMSVLVEKEKELQTQRDATMAKLREAYLAAKALVNVPEGMELDIETGEPIKPPAQ